MDTGLFNFYRNQRVRYKMMVFNVISHVDPDLEKVSLPAGVLGFTFGQNVEKVSLPAGLQTFTFVEYMVMVALPAGLQHGQTPQ